MGKRVSEFLLCAKANRRKSAEWPSHDEENFWPLIGEPGWDRTIDTLSSDPEDGVVSQAKALVKAWKAASRFSASLFDADD